MKAKCYLAIQAKDFYKENYKTLVKDIKEVNK